MNTDTMLPTRLKAGSPGLGHPSQTEIDARAAELALIDGRSTVSDADLAMAAAELMGSVYWRLLKKLEGHQFNVFGPEPTRVSKSQKILLILRTWLRIASGNVAPNYGAP